MNNMMGVSVEMARMAKMSFCRWPERERERPRERKLRKGEHSFRQLKFQIFATELHLHLYHLSTRVTQFVAVLFLQLYHICTSNELLLHVFATDIALSVDIGQDSLYCNSVGHNMGKYDICQTVTPTIDIIS